MMSENGETARPRRGSFESMKAQDDIYYAATMARDPRFDGKFFVGVKTTGIYCRPICPAKPKRENVEFFAGRAEAERRGYRPCLRCRPESAPLSPAWMGKSALVQRALRLMRAEGALEPGEDAFADRLGVSARHLRRLFQEEIGKTPAQLLQDERLNLARKLLVETALPIAEVAFAAGFRSLRRFNAAFRERFARAPREIRRQKLAAGAPFALNLAYRPPFDFGAQLDFYRTHQVGDLEWFDEDAMHRIVEFGGKVGRITVRNDEAHNQLRVEIDFPDLSYLPAILARVRTLFDLDADPVLIANALGQDRAVAKLLEKHPGIRLPCGWDPFEVGVGTILGQFVSLACARSLVRSLVMNLGPEVGTPAGPRNLFPSAASIAASDLAFVKTTGGRRATLRAFAAAVAEGRLSLAPTQDPEEFRRALLAIKGIGPWTANYMALKVLRHTDSFPETDLILARVLERHPLATLEKFRPWRGYAAILFWREYAEKLSKPRAEKTKAAPKSKRAKKGKKS